jgi:predicted O-methyltransferase YrrM
MLSAYNRPEARRQRKANLEQAYALSSKVGYVVECGVAGGRSMRLLARLSSDDGRVVYGFDSFDGLPDDWVKDKENKTVPAGAHKQSSPPEIMGAKYRIGLFESTLPKWTQECPGMIALLHIDSDLYSSCVTVLESLNKQIVPGTIIVFDEMFEGYWYPEWREGEYKAFNEWKEKYNRKAVEVNRTDFGEATFCITE